MTPQHMISIDLIAKEDLITIQKAFEKEHGVKLRISDAVRLAVKAYRTANPSLFPLITLQKEGLEK